MQWYIRDKDRLRAEIMLMEDAGVNFDLYEDEEGNLLWRGSVSIMGHYHGDVRLVYDKNHPYEPITVYVLEPKLPPVNPHIHPDGSICYIKPEEWSPEWTALAVYLTTIRFLRDFYSGKMENGPPSIMNSFANLLRALG